MSQQIAFKALGTVVVGLELLVEFLAIGPLGWAVIGAVRVRERFAGAEAEGGKPPTYCGYCGSPFGGEARRPENSSEAGRGGSHCPICGAAITLSSGGADARGRNLPRDGCP